ncbi:MAG: pyruvate kinase [Acidobacteria bacterium]|nr:pyruvate kinase [Acidobacteriota bacterium]
MPTRKTHPVAAPVGRRAKIVCTLGPASANPEVLAKMLEAGMDVVRFNFSHGTHAEHAGRLALLRRLAAKHSKTIAILQDLQGPKIRTGRLERGAPVELCRGKRVTITTRVVAGSDSVISTTFAALPASVGPRNRILLSDGRIELRVERVRGREIECLVVEGGELREHQGINLPGAALKTSALTAKDRADLQFGIRHGVDYVALSFVRRPEDVLELKRLIRRARREIPVVVKLEKPEAIGCLEEILAVADAVMVARGDLGVEMPPEDVPVIQKRIVARANELRVPVIVATQMLESMTSEARPTRAEASDVANAIFDGADALMLSGETAVGLYPVESVSMMARIIAAAEASPRREIRRRREGHISVPEAIGDSASLLAEDLNLRAIAVFTQSGSSARLVSKFRPRVPVYAFSPFPEILRRAALYWGVTPIGMSHVSSTEGMVEGAARMLRARGVVKAGDLIAVVAGTPLARRGSTNFLKVHRVE